MQEITKPIPLALDYQKRNLYIGEMDISLPFRVFSLWVEGESYRNNSYHIWEVITSNQARASPSKVLPTNENRQIPILSIIKIIAFRLSSLSNLFVYQLKHKLKMILHHMEPGEVSNRGNGRKKLSP